MDKALESLGYEELLELRKEVNERIKKFKPLRIRKKFKRCGKDGCVCQQGPADGSWGNLHGPYLFAQFQDKNGNTRVRSLGKWYDRKDILDTRMKPKRPLYEAFTVPLETWKEKYEGDGKNWVYWDLDDFEFEERYGLPPGEDTFNRHRRLYGLKSDYDRWVIENELRLDRIEGAEHVWAETWGLADLKGQAVLAELLAGEYFLVY